MTAHKFKVGQRVNYTPSRSTLQASSREYTIVRLLPPELGQNQYRIKGATETFERMASELDLAKK
jgi:hypothetical protein